MSAQPKPPTNVIWITTDHLRHDFVGAYGSEWMHTPNIDRLASGGIRFEHCLANAPLCMPSRCSFMTGCYPHQTGVIENGQELPPAWPTTAPRCFSAGGYRTVQIGKLHFQCHEDHDLDPRARHDYGFDVFELSEEPGCYEDAYRIWLRGEHPEHVETFTVPRPASPARKKEFSSFHVLDAPWQLSHSGWIAEQTERYLFSWGRGGQPQFLHLGFYAPHPPLNPTKEMMEPYRGVAIPDPISSDPTRISSTHTTDTIREYRRHFAAMVTGIDLAVGQLVDALDRNGVLDETLIVFSSDHGDLCGDHGGLSKGYSYYDGIMRLPLIFHWPKGLGSGARTFGGMIEMVDVLPTLLGLCHLSVPSSMPGINLAPRLLSDGHSGSDKEEARNDVFAVGRDSLMLRTMDRKYIRYTRNGETEEVLYDLKKDPSELHDRASDPDYASDLGRLRDHAFSRLQRASTPVNPKRMAF